MGDSIPDPDRRRKLARDKARRSRAARENEGLRLREGPDLGEWDERDLIRLPATSGLAVASLAAAVLSMGLLVFASVPALILGGMALHKIRASRGRLGGKNLAIAAVLIAALTTLISIPVGVYLYEHRDDPSSLAPRQRPGPGPVDLDDQW